MTACNIPSLEHLDRLTDSTGLIQHAIYSVPRRESGYTTDDNARALRLCTRLWSECPDDRMLHRVSIYMSFLEHARCPVRGFHNFLSYQRNWLDASGKGDCLGQAVLAIAEVLASNLPDGFRLLARELLHGAMSAMTEVRSLRAQAYIIQAFAMLKRCDVADQVPMEGVVREAADHLLDCYQRSQRPDWPWFESAMTYANAVLPHAMFDAADCWPDGEFLSVARTSFGFLDLVTTSDNVFWPIGNRRWYSHGEEKSLYDQQPVEASTMAAAALAACRSLADEKYLTVFRKAYRWFFGENCMNKTLADPRDGSCFDGLGPTGINKNQGAESTLAYLWTELHGSASKQTASGRTKFADVGV